ncbi:DUF3344 domain-containing protein [Kitasatospora sp. NBC_00070]|uniref:hypothetical protein n=1 Tax=Kitasatospora sp. NBC_00070 TaxID=2975962 RepID=UPI003244CC7D
MSHRHLRRSSPRTLALAVAVTAAACTLAAPAAQSRAADDVQASSITLAENRLPFETRFEGNFHGSVTHISNSLMTCDETKPPVDPAQPPCEQARTGAGSRPINNNYEMKYVNIDPGSIGPFGDAVYSASSADLALPEGSAVRYARLYWGGTRGIDGVVLPESQIDEIYLKLPGDAQYTNIPNDQPSIGYITTDDESSYQASADVTELVRQHGPGTYTGANMDSVVKPHSWGGWTLVVAYEDPCEPLRHVHVWDGFQPELPNSPALSGTLTGIKAPATGPVSGHLGWVVYDGDHKWNGDTMSLKSTNGPLTPFSDANHPADDAFNSTVDIPGAGITAARNPAPRNNFGHDATRWDVSPYLRNGDTDVTITVDTDGDGYNLGVFYADINLDTTQFAPTTTPQTKSAWSTGK